MGHARFLIIKHADFVPRTSCFFTFVKELTKYKKPIAIFIIQNEPVSLYDFWSIMANEPIDSMTTFQQPVREVRELMERYQILKAENEQLKQELEWRKNDLAEVQKTLLGLQEQHNRLLTAYALLGGNEQEKKAARDKISRMVREIDKCLALLLE